MNRLERKILKKLDNDEINYNKLSRFIIDKCNNVLFGKRNRKIVVELIPLLMENIYKDKTFYNKNHFIIDCLLPISYEDRFKGKFIEGISKLNKENNSNFISSIISVLKLIELNEFEVRKVIDNIADTGIMLNYIDLDSLYHFINNEFPFLVNYMLNKYIVNDSTMCSVILFISNNKEYINIVYDNIDVILNNRNVDLFELRDLVLDNKEMYLKTKEKIDSNGKENINRLVTGLFKKKLIESNMSDNEKDLLNTVIEIIYFIIDDLCKYENVSVSNLNFLGSGSFFKVYSIGDKVIKIGSNRGTKKFINNPYVNAMLLRKEFSITDNFSIFVEVSERVDTKSIINEEEMYDLYKKVRKLHLIWVDVEPRNVGRLLKDNKVHWRENLPLTDERLELNTYRGNDTLKKGDIVIIDNDFIYDENNKDKINYSTPLQRKFEARYLSENTNYEETGNIKDKTTGRRR